MKFLLGIGKRRRFLITSIILSLGFVLIQSVDSTFRLFGIGGLGLVTIALFSWSLWEGLGKNATLLSLILPLYFTLGVGFFWFLLPTSILTRIPIVIVYGLGIYALTLTANIYTVSAIRTIALLRAAKGIGFVLTLITAFLAINTLLSTRPEVYVGPLLTFVATFPLFVQGLWVASVETHFERNIFTMSAIFSLITAQVYLVLYFWPATLVVSSLFLTTVLYTLLGLGQARIEQRLFSQTVREYTVVGLLVLIGMFFATRWS